jgi:hypothetical protein
MAAAATAAPQCGATTTANTTIETESLFELSFFKVGTPVKARIDPNVSPPAFLPSAAGSACAEEPCTFTVGWCIDGN